MLFIRVWICLTVNELKPELSFAPIAGAEVSSAPARVQWMQQPAAGILLHCHAQSLGACPSQLQLSPSRDALLANCSPVQPQPCVQRARKRYIAFV